MKTSNRLREIRDRRRMPAAQLARQAGVTRQTIYAIEAGNYVPNTTVALQLARLLEVRIEDLFQLEAEPEMAPKPVRVDVLGSAGAGRNGQSVQLCLVGKRLVGVAVDPQAITLAQSDGVVVRSAKSTQQQTVQIFENDLDHSRRLLVAGCDPGISLVSQQLARSQNVELIIAPSSSRQALEWLKAGKVHVAGSHLREGGSGEYNLPIISKLFAPGAVKVVTFAIWEQGLVVQDENPKGIRSVDDLARKDVRIINREEGAGSRDLLDQKLCEAGIPVSEVTGYGSFARGHLAAALAVSLNEADCCVATRAAAQTFGLSFVPWATERYDLVILRQHFDLPPLRALMDSINGATMRRKLEILARYDTSHTGELLVA
jgi:putative molybdopterin biosynthesis protein